MYVHLHETCMSLRYVNLLHACNEYMYHQFITLLTCVSTACQNHSVSDINSTRLPYKYTHVHAHKQSQQLS